MKIVLGIIALIVLFIVWRLYATVVGGRKAYRTLLTEIAPITEALRAGREPAAADYLFAHTGITRNP